MNREAKILEKTYPDSLTAWRGQLVTKPDGESAMTPVLLYDGECCALSKGSASKSRQAGVMTTEKEYVIFTLPDVGLRDGDKVQVTTETGQVYIGRTGRSFAYLSHCETPVKLEGIS